MYAEAGLHQETSSAFWSKIIYSVWHEKQVMVVVDWEEGHLVE